MLKGKCEICGKTYFGWALKQEEHQTCVCGAKLKISEAGQPKINNLEVGYEGNNELSSVFGHIGSGQSIVKRECVDRFLF